DAGRLLEEVPENRDVLYLVAVSQRYLGRIDDALGTLRRFEELHPDFGRLFQERGHCYRTAGDSARAIEAYRQAVGLNPSLLASAPSERCMRRRASDSAITRRRCEFIGSCSPRRRTTRSCTCRLRTR